MKRLASLLLALMLVLSVPFATLADMGMPEEPLFESFVVTGNFVMNHYDGFKTPLPFGQKLSFYDKYYDDEQGTNLWMCSATLSDDEYFWGNITDEQMRLTMPSNEVFKATNAPEPEYEVTATVTAEPCLNLRNGPATGFDILTVIPLNAVITYRYVYQNKGEKWAYTSYEGKSGWVSLDYVVTEKSVLLKTYTDDYDDDDGDSGETVKAEDIDPWGHLPENGDSGFLSAVNKMFGNNSGRMIIFCIIGAIILAATVTVVVILIVHFDKKRNSLPQSEIDINN